MRLRTDSYHEAGWKRAQQIGARGDVASSILDDPIPAAEPGDIWIIRGNSEDWGTQSWGDAHDDWPIIGYAMTCPNESCRFGVHDWTFASNCSERFPDPGDGPRCTHERDRRSCWNWTGSIADNTLGATPSLHSPAEKGGCGFHGFLTNGVLA